MAGVGLGVCAMAVGVAMGVGWHCALRRWCVLGGLDGGGGLCTAVARGELVDRMVWLKSGL